MPGETVHGRNEFKHGRSVKMDSMQMKMSPEGGDVVIAVTANFTADPLKNILLFWAARLGLGSVRIGSSGYNQVFQDLTRHDSALASGEAGINCILIRLEDWGRNTQHDWVQTVMASGQEFINHLDAFSRRALRPTILVLCPPSERVSSDSELSKVCKLLESDIRSAAAALRGVNVITTEDIADLYPVESINDEESDRQGHIPFTNSYWVAIGTMVCRRARTFIQPPYKVIAVDADNTLWDGVVGELGPEQIQISGARRTFHEFLCECKRRGMLLALISKNREADVADVFQRPDMTLRSGDFVAWKVNWEPKSQNLRTLASDLDLGLDSFVFLDDNPTECAEVMANCPSATVLCVPPNAEDVPTFLRHVWAFDLPPTTSADSGRTEQYRQQAERNSFRRNAVSFRNFIESLDLRVEVIPLGVEHLERAAQLTQRTNQFNTTGRRRTVSELASILSTSSNGALLLRVRDRFGDYGEVGLCIFSEGAGGLEVENFLLSCRVLGKGVEHRMLAALGRLATERGHEHLIVPFRQTERNEPAAKFLKAIGESFWYGDCYRIPAVQAAKIVFEPVEENQPTVVGDSTSGSKRRPAQRLCNFEEIATKLATISDIEGALHQHYGTRRPEMAVEYKAPGNYAEQTLADIWASVLGLDRVGIHDNFFDLGGDSILAIQVISRASQDGLRYTLRQQFELPTIAELASVVGGNSSVSLEVEEDAAVGRAPLTPIQCWFFEKDLPAPNYWNMEVVLQANVSISHDILKQAFSLVIAHHDALRLRFFRDETGWCQEKNDQNPEGLFNVHHFSSLSAEVQDKEMRRAIADAHSSLDLAAGFLARGLWFDLGHIKPARLVVIIHHLVVDGVTWRLLLEDLQRAYFRLLHDQPINLPRKTNSYLQWANRLQAFVNSDSISRIELEYWTNLASAKNELLPVDYPESRFEGTEETARTVIGSLNREETSSLLTEVPRTYQTQINDVLLTALCLTFRKWTGQTSFLIDLEGHGRESIFHDLDVSRTAGWFTSIFPVCLQLERSADLSHSLKFIKEQLRAIPNRGIGYSLLRYLHRDPMIRSALCRPPAAEVMFNYLGQFDQVMPANGLFGWAEANGSGVLLHGPGGRRSHLLEIIGRVTGGLLQLEWIYSERVYRQQTVERLAQDFNDNLRALIRYCASTGSTAVTPLEFPLARLGQHSLDEVIARLQKGRR